MEWTPHQDWLQEILHLLAQSQHGTNNDFNRNLQQASPSSFGILIIIKKERNERRRRREEEEENKRRREQERE